MTVLDNLLVRLGVDMSDAQAEVDAGAQGIEDRLNGMAVAGGVAAAGLGAAFVAGLESAMDISSVTTQLENQLNLTGEEAARAGDIAGEVFSAGFGESVGDVGEALSAVASSMHEFGSISDAEMTQLTKDALALAKTFQFDVGEATAAAGNLIKAGLAKDGTEAMDLLAATARQVPAAMREELPAVSKEYSEFFNQLGFTGPQMFGLLAQAAKDPTFELDKLGDAVKEFSLLLAETDAVKGPLKELKLDVADIQALVNEGKGTQAFDQVVTALKGVEDQTTRTRLQAALFGGPGEDMGNSLLNLSATGADAATGLDDAAGAAKRVTDGMEGSAAQQWDSIVRQVSTTLGEMLLPVLTAVGGFFKEHPTLLKVLIIGLGALAAVLAVAAAAQFVMNSALLMSPITWIVLAIIALVVAIVLIATKTTWFQDLWEAVWGAIKAAAGAVADWFTGTVWPAIKAAWNGIKAAASAVASWFTGTLLARITGVWKAISGGAKTMWETVKRWWNSLVSFVTGIPGRISRAVSGMWNGIPRAFRSAVNGVIGAWNGLSFTIGGGSFMGVDVPHFTLSTPNIPYLAEGGIVTRPTLAMVGEGREDEVVLPLSRLEGLLNTTRAPSAGAVRPVEPRLVLDFRGTDQKFQAFFQESVRTRGGGSVERYAGG